MEEESISYERGLTFEKVWATIQELAKAADRRSEETDRRFQETDRQFQEIKQRFQETDRQFQEIKQQFQETDRKFQETDRQFKEIALQSKETDRFLKDIGRQIGGLHRNFGELAEHLVAPGIVKRFNEAGFHFESIAEGNYKILKPNGAVRTEIDLLLENTQHLIAVEVKTKPAEQDIDHHIERLKILREHTDAKHDGRKILGAIAGAVFLTEVKQLTLEAGLYVLEQSGDTMQIELPEGFVPKEW
jgi:hypothetical protein